LKKEGLVEVSGFFAFLCFFIEAQNFIDDLYVREKHTATAVAFKPKLPVRHWVSPSLSGV
jgi:hypothetical protein